MKCKLCHEIVTEKHKHLFDKHTDIALKIFSYTFHQAKQDKVQGDIIPVENMPGIYQPDEEMYAGFEATWELQSKQIDLLSEKYFEE